MQVTVGTNKEHVMTGAVMLEPSTTFMERHGLLVERSISYAHAGRMLVTHHLSLLLSTNMKESDLFIHWMSRVIHVQNTPWLAYQWFMNTKQIA